MYCSFVNSAGTFVYFLKSVPGNLKLILNTVKVAGNVQVMMVDQSLRTLVPQANSSIVMFICSYRLETST